MSEKQQPTSRLAMCINNADYPASLELRKVYRVIPDEDAAKDGDIRVIDESGESYLYPAAWFTEVTLPQEAYASLSDDELTHIADEVFQELDRHEEQV